MDYSYPSVKSDESTRKPENHAKHTILTQIKNTALYCRRQRTHLKYNRCRKYMIILLMASICFNSEILEKYVNKFVFKICKMLIQKQSRQIGLRIL